MGRLWRLECGVVWSSLCELENIWLISQPHIYMQLKIFKYFEIQLFFDIWAVQSDRHKIVQIFHSHLFTLHFL